ncbi:protein ZGRF1 isoform X1 [Colius striatus]|uniref:protein ZGRF1 isoform X1 n=1 Tax=Colius striatus TaxID=57412 RepID=UPI002B1E5EB6|nr:protein ZGRF1 isoform X1 [Colius striatus]
MASQEFIVLYTHQKMKKSKTWQDGILRMRSGGNKAILFDDKGQCLESIFVTSQVNIGDNLESERYLITVEAVKVNEKSFEDQPRKAVTSTVDRNSGKSGILPPRHLSVGLKRKFTGFQGPRQVEKKISTMEDGEKTTILPLSKQCQDTFPSKFFVTSPLFSTICKKDVETNLSADFREDTCMDNDREHTSLSSLLSAPFLGRCEETGNQNSDQFVVKPKSPIITRHTKSSNHAANHGVMSHSIRSTAQVIALLNSQPTQGCREPTTSEATEHVSRFQTSENLTSLCNQKTTILPAFSAKPPKRLIENIQHLPSMRRTINENKECNAALLLNLAEQSCDQEVAGQRHAEKANSLSQDLQDPCNINSCILPESAIRRMNDSQFVPSSGDILCSASPVNFKKDLSAYREHSVTNGLKENSSVKLPSELQPRQSLERVPHHPELSVDITLTETGIVKEEFSTGGQDCDPDEQVMEVNFSLMEAFDFNDRDNEDLCERDVNKLTDGDTLSQSPDCLNGEDVAPNASQRLGSCCEVVTHCQNEKIKCSMFNRENGGNYCPGDTPPQLCDNSFGDTGRIAEGSANQNRIEVELLGDGHNIKEINERQLSTEATNSKEDLAGCTVHTISATSWIKSKPSDLLPSDTNVDGCQPKTTINQFTEMPYSESVQASSCSYFDSAGLMPNCVDNVIQKREACILPVAVAQRDPRTSDCQPKSPGSRSLYEDDTDFIREETFQDKSDIIKELRTDESPLALNVYSGLPPWTSDSPSCSDLRQTHWTSWEPDKDIAISELSFPNADKVKHASLPKRKISIPTVFQSHVQYKQIFKAALTEQLNIMLFELSQRLHHALAKVDISFYTSLKDGQSESQASRGPLCNHMHPAKLVTVKKEGQNKGRMFYTCDAPKAEQCSFFKWIEDVNPAQIKSRPSLVLHDIKSIGTYLRSQKISLYEGCQLLVRRAFEIQTQRCSKFKKYMNIPDRYDGDSKTKLYLKLSRKEHYSLYSKDDIWVVSKTLNFDLLDTFIASSVFFGPSSNNEVELLPLKGYCPSNWRSNTPVHALLVCNASGELTALRNMEEHFNPSTLPLIPYLLKMNFDSENATNRGYKRKFIPPAVSLKHTMMPGPVSAEVVMGLAKKMIQKFSLNPDQTTALIQIAHMMTSCENTKPVEGHRIFPVTIIRGVFGAGKSYLLSVVILFLVQLFESSEATEGPRPVPWKLLIASSTNVAVDRILLCLLDLGFEDFIRVGSIRKITKAILPHSLHAGSGNENEQLKELFALMKEDLTPVEKMYVRKSIEQHKLGTNKTILQQVKVVGVTCAACPFPCLNTLKFPVVLLDECSQMTEPASLLPIARFQCEKLVLVGDPKQLPPTIQGSESHHEKGLEQTLFDRLCLMGHKPTLLRTQYRCHPAISAIANELFYEGNLIDGVSEKDRSPVLDWLPTLCFYNVNGVEQMEIGNSFYNMAEAHFTVKLIQSLIASGIEASAIGVITLYKSQMTKIQNLVNGVHSEAFELQAVQVSTVDAFQGAEKEIIVLSCVRTRQIGFIDSEKRMNVALTRAKRHLLIVGNLACLSRNQLWGRVIHHCKGWENGLQHVSQCEQQLNNILQCYLEQRKAEEQNKKKVK